MIGQYLDSLSKVRYASLKGGVYWLIRAYCTQAHETLLRSRGLRSGIQRKPYEVEAIDLLSEALSSADGP
jgi:hypothetical protein